MGDITVSQSTGALKPVQGKAEGQIEPQARRLEKIKKDSAVSFDELRVNLDEAMKSLASIAGVYFVSVAAIVAAFYGKEAYTKGKANN